MDGHENVKIITKRSERQVIVSDLENLLRCNMSINHFLLCALYDILIHFLLWCVASTKWLLRYNAEHFCPHAEKNKKIQYKRSLVPWTKTVAKSDPRTAFHSQSEQSLGQPETNEATEENPGDNAHWGAPAE